MAPQAGPGRAEETAATRGRLKRRPQPESPTSCQYGDNRTPLADQILTKSPPPALASSDGDLGGLTHLRRSRPIDSTQLLSRRDAAMERMQDAFNSPGRQIAQVIGALEGRHAKTAPAASAPSLSARSRSRLAEARHVPSFGDIRRPWSPIWRACSGNRLPSSDTIDADGFSSLVPRRPAAGYDSFVPTNDQFVLRPVGTGSVDSQRWMVRGGALIQHPLHIGYERGVGPTSKD